MRRRMPVHAACRTLWLGMVAFLLGACAARMLHLYAGPALPPARIATLCADSTIVLLGLDAKLLPQGVTERAVAILPGRHEVRFGYAHEICFYVDSQRGRECKRFHAGQAVLGFAAVAGHDYWIHAAPTMTGWKPFIRDTTSGAVVAESGREMRRNPPILFLFE